MFVPEDGTGLPDANSFVTLAFADAYFAERPNETWSTATTVAKQSALLYATRWLNWRYPWRGGLKEFDQGLSFPRVGMVDSDGRIYADDEVPTLIKEATCELAANQAGDGVLNRLDDLGGPLSQITVDVITIKFRDWTPGAWSIDFVTDLVRPLLAFVSVPGFSTGQMLRA